MSAKATAPAPAPAQAPVQARAEPPTEAPLAQSPAPDALQSLPWCQPALALRAVVGVQAVLALAVLVATSGPLDALSRFGLVGFAGLAATLLWLVTVCALRGPLDRQPAAHRAAWSAFIGAWCACIAYAPLGWSGLAPSATAWRWAGLAVLGAALALVLERWLAGRMRGVPPLAAQARLAELQARIHPHFLFNALNTALALVRRDPAGAETVLEDLAQLFRAVLEDTGPAVSLQEEMALARAYLAIEQARFGPRLRLHWAVDDDPRVASARVPPLVLQPLVENAIRHGVEPAAGPTDVWVRAGVQRGQVVVLVSNTTPEEPAPKGHGMAVANVRERLRLLHDVAAQCDTWREGEWFRARIVLPVEI